MAVTVSGMYLPTWMAILNATQLAVDLTSTTQHKAALYNNSITPNYSTDTAYSAAPYTTNQITGTGYTAGGATLTGTAVAESPTGTIAWSASNVSWASSTLSGVRCVLIYADGLAGKNALVLVTFGADYSTTNGTFQITWGSAILTLDITP